MNSKPWELKFSKLLGSSAFPFHIPRVNMLLKQLYLGSLVFLGSATACLHDQIRAPRSLDDELAALHKRQVPARVKTAIRNVRVFNGFTVSHPQTVVIDGEHISTNDWDIEQNIDARGGVLIPGLIDAHAHVQGVDGLQNMTSYGVTTIFNMGCPSYELCSALKSNPGLASLYASMLPAIGQSGKSNPLNPLPEALLLSPGEDPKFLVDYAFGNGSDYFKIMNARVGGPTQEQQNTLVEYAHSRGYFVVTHAPGSELYTEAVAAKTDVLQHIPDDGVLGRCVFDSIRANRLAATPTMEIFRRAYSFQPQILQFLRGSTIPLGYYPYGESLHQELVSFVNDVGMSPAEALRAATVVPAAVHRLHDRGAILPGMRADLILLNSNPLDDISNTRDIARVWAGGVEYLDVAKKA